MAARPPHPLRPPLGLPTGSVRATLALILCGSLWYLVVRGRAVPDLLASAALLVVAFYFGVRSTAPVTAPPAPGEKVRQPLYLPRGSVRTLLLIGFLGVIAYMWYGGRPLPQTLVLILQVLVSYLIGFAFAVLVNRRIQAGKGPSLAVVVVRHGIAFLALAVTAVVCASILFGMPSFVPPDAEKALAWTVAFYFGARLSP